MRGIGISLIALFFYTTPVYAAAPDNLILPLLTHSSRFILQLGVLIFAAKIGGRFFVRWHQPKVLGELLSGVIIGPYLLGGLPLPLFSAGLMSNASTMLTAPAPMYGVVTISLMVLFFLFGLETDIQQLRPSAARGVMVGLAGFLSCFGVALSLLVWLSPGMSHQYPVWLSPAALFVSTIVSVTSVGLLARMLAARKRLESPAGGIVLTAAMTDNLCGLLFFTIFSGMAAGVSAGFTPSNSLLSEMTLRAMLGFALVAVCGYPIAHYMNTLALREKNYVGVFVVSSACLFIAGGVMGILGLSVMSGAYMMGVAFSATDVRHEIRERLDLVNVVLVPACFAILGMQINLRSLIHLQVAPSTLLIIFLSSVMLAKILGSALSSRLAHLTFNDCLHVGVLTLPRGELSLAMLMALLGITALPTGLFHGVILLIIISCACASLLTKRLAAWETNAMPETLAPAKPAQITLQLPSMHTANLLINRTVAIFEADGFYAHLLNRHQILYRISRENQVIHLHGDNAHVVFNCAEHELPLVNTVLRELSSEVEQDLRELQRPLNDILLSKDIQHGQAEITTAGVAGILRNRFTIETLKPRLLATTKQGAISELVSLLYENGLVMDREQAISDVFEREHSLSTGLEYGLAMPHARTDAVTRLTCAVGLKQEGLDFDAADHRPTRIVVLILAPTHAATPQLQLIAQLCRLLDEQGRAALLASETAEDMFNFLTSGTDVGTLADKKISALAQSLKWPSISLDLAAGNQAEALALLLALCVRSGAVESAEEVRKTLLTFPPRQPEQLSAKLAFFAIETTHVYQIVTALGVNTSGIPCPDGNRYQVCVMTLYPPSAQQACQQVRSALTRLVQAEELQALLAMQTNKEVLSFLQKYKS